MPFPFQFRFPIGSDRFLLHRCDTEVCDLREICAPPTVLICQFMLCLVRTPGLTPLRNLEINALPGLQTFHSGLPCFTPCLSGGAISARLDSENRRRDLKSTCPAVQQDAQTPTISQEAGLVGITANTKTVMPRSSWIVHPPGNRGCLWCDTPEQRTVTNCACSRTEASLRPSYICTVSPCCRSLAVTLDGCKCLLIEQLSSGTNGAFCEFENGMAVKKMNARRQVRQHPVLFNWQKHSVTW